VKRLAVTAAGVAAALLASAPAASARIDSGVRGFVTMSGCPGPVRDGDTCTSRYPGATVRVVRVRDGVLVKVFHSRSDGRFRVHLRSGRYRLVPERAGVAYARPVTVRVRAHRYRYVHIDFDRGLL
jgi:hypothetical protein